MPERFQDEAELIGGSRTSIDYVAGDQMAEKENEALTAVVLRGIVETQAAIQDETKKIADSLHTIALDMKEVSVRIEPLSLLQASVNTHEGKIARIERDLENADKERERGFRVLLCAMGAVTSIFTLVAGYVLSHAKFG